MKISIIIKAFNEEEKIESCLNSVIESTRVWDTEIILVDSISTDSTLEIAKKFPIKIIQFLNDSDASCGSAPQLGFQESSGDYLLLIDGDMTLKEGFVEQAITALTSDERLAGVAGIIEDSQQCTTADPRRSTSYSKVNVPVDVMSLGGGGLYKRDAIQSVGYFSNRYLKASEELELGIRLIKNGYKLIRLPIASVTHTGHRESNLKRFTRLWKTGRLKSYSNLLKASWNKPWFLLALRKSWFLFILPVSILLSFTLGAFFNSSLMVFYSFLVFWVASCLALIVKHRSLSLTADSLISWWLYALTIPSFFYFTREDPMIEIEYKVIK